jgi:hypothetical protein
MHVARVTTAPPSTSPRAGSAPIVEKTPAASTDTLSDRYARQERADREAARADREAHPERTADATLPHTASPLPLVGLVGLASLAGSAALRLASRKR